VRGIRNILPRTKEVNCLFHLFERGVLFSFVQREETIKADRCRGFLSVCFTKVLAAEEIVQHAAKKINFEGAAGRQAHLYHVPERFRLRLYTVSPIVCDFRITD
jgi:hypothetical protein